MNKALKSKLIMAASMVAFMIFYMLVFGNKNAAIGTMIIMAAFMNLGNDLSFKPKLSFIRILTLLLILGVASFLNNPLTIWGCILTFVVVFLTTFSSYHLFGTHVYLPYLMCYFMMVGIPIGPEGLPMRLLSLAFGAIFIVGLNVLINKKKTYKLSKATLDSLINELKRTIDLKLAGKEVSEESFKTVNGFYLSIFNKFEYKYFPTNTQKSVLNVVKSFQSIGAIIANYNLKNFELEYIKEFLSSITEIDLSNIFTAIGVESKEMYVVLLNLEIIAYEVKNKDLTNVVIIPDRNTIKLLFKPIIKIQSSFKSVKFTFAFKMALMLFVWQILTLIFNLPFTKWLYFITIPLMLPYVDDLADTAKARVKGTLAGVFIFALIMIFISHIHISYFAFMMIVMIICLLVMTLKIEDKFIMTVASTIMSVTSALMYITPPQAIELKVLWVVIGAGVVSLFNFKFLPYSVQKESEDNLKACYDLNGKFIELIKEKCRGSNADRKTSLLVVDNLIRENIEITDNNKKIYDLQIRISDICNFILTYLELYDLSDDLKDNLISIIDNNSDVNKNLNVKDNVIAYSMKHVISLYVQENKLI